MKDDFNKDNFDDEPVSNTSANKNFEEILQRRISRRTVLQGGLSAAVLSMFGLPAVANPLRDALGSALGNPLASPLLGFTGIPISTADTIEVPPGYIAKVLYAWGDPVSDAPAFQMDASNSAADQEQQSGDHHDGIQFYPLPYHSNNSQHGLLVMNHEYMDPNTMHTDGRNPRTAEKVRKEQAAHGVSVIEVRRRGWGWEVVRPSSYARRVTGFTPMRISGPLAGSDFARTAADPEGVEVLGTLNNCAHGFTPWGTYLTCEENWAGYWVNRSGDLPREQSRYGVRTTSSRYDWELFNERFDAERHPNEPNRFGWVVEIDPYDPDSKPVKRTAMGRFAHEGAWPSIASDNRIAFYMGDDARFEYIYKFVTRDPYHPTSREANRNLLDHGTLYAARFNEDGTGEWLALEYGANGLSDENGFSSQADVLVNTRLAADFVGATKMDRPEWGNVHPPHQGGVHDPDQQHPTGRGAGGCGQPKAQ